MLRALGFATFQQFTVQRKVLLRLIDDVEILLHPLAASSSHLVSKTASRNHLANLKRQGFGVFGFRQKTGRSVRDVFADPAAIEADDRCPASHRFQADLRLVVFAGRNNNEIARRIDLRHPLDIVDVSHLMATRDLRIGI